MFGSLRSPATASPGRPDGPQPPPAPATDRTSDPSSIARAASMPSRAPTRSGGPATRRSLGRSACGVGSWSTSTGSVLPSRTRNACDLCATCASRCGGGERRGTVRSSFGIAAVAWFRCANRTSSSAAGTGTGCRGFCRRGRSDPLSGGIRRGSAAGARLGLGELRLRSGCPLLGLAELRFHLERALGRDGRAPGSLLGLLLQRQPSSPP